MRRHDAALANDAVLLAPGDDLSREQQQRTIGVVDQHQAVHLSAIAAWRDPLARTPANQRRDLPGFSDHHLAGA